ncbi:hypothetical protein Nocox_36380 [Nonomuraea coxensis DSM 45129]|uniref:Uncharacterized protein n=1 Tax=Nonomuraea coxensis DSM 45129 TaxID=1122611 RepID=A0ABX8UAQ8_9ACTN|nr:hypothetical protein [Nonomuraea coxensis]QYC44830.1 hypothetical protein Nocox_36380 [Nonomuraea coxensis DSM 45129]
MTLDEQRISAELRRMADEARPVDPLVHARRARAGSTRRRRLSLSVAGLAAAASVITAVTVVTGVTGGGPGQVTAAEVDRLPDNTPEQARAVRACMPQGGPVHSMDGRRRIPEHGSVEDFRMLVEYRDEDGSTALVGSRSGFVLCTPSTREDLAERAVFTYWGFEAPGNMRGFPGALQVDAYTVQSDYDEEGPAPAMTTRTYRVVAGRVGADVRRVEIDWADGRRTDARVADGFFIARALGKSVPRPGGGKDAVGRPITVLDTPPVTVTAYGARNQVLEQVKDEAFGPLGRGTGY